MTSSPPLQVLGRGSTTADIFILSDGATDSDCAAGYALTGEVERLLREFSKAHGLHFDEFWKTTLIKERINLRQPDANRELLTDRYKEILISEINDVNPNVIVPIGELGFEFLTGLKGIRKFRGSVLPLNGSLNLKRADARVVPTLGPNPYLNEDPKFKFIVRNDFAKVARQAHCTGPILEVGNIWICETGSALRAYIDRQYPKSQFLVFDIETFANLPTCISLCFDGAESCCVPILDYKIPLDQRVVMLGLILKLLASPIPKVNQNVKFDWRKLARLGWKVEHVVGDTMLNANLLYCEFPKNLGFLTSLYTDMPYFKDEGKEFDPAKYDRKKLYFYNAKDSLATHQIYAQQTEEIQELGLEYTRRLLIDILPIYREMEENGILVNDTQRKKLLASYWILFQIHCAKLNKLVGREMNPLSSKSMGELVYNDLKWKVVRGVKHTKSGAPSTDEESLELLMWSSDCNSSLGRQILRCIIDCRKFHKVIEVLELPTYPDGRHRCEFNLAGTETGRTSASETTDYYLIYEKGKIKLINLGHSFQTIGKHGFVVDGIEYGKDLRSIFVPSPGYSFVEMDLSQAEARVDAVLARDFQILSVFDSPTGIHRLTGSWIYNCSPNEIVKNRLVDGVDRYHESKTVRHAGERNMRANRLLMMIHKPIKECEKILSTFHERQPNIRQVFHRDIREAVQKRSLISPTGRRRDFYGRIDEHAINEGISFLPQAIVTDYLKEGIRKTLPTVRDFVRPLSEAHDGFLVEVQRGREAEYARLFKQNVEQLIDFEQCTLSREYKLTIPCESEWSDTNWQNLKELYVDTRTI